MFVKTNGIIGMKVLMFGWEFPPHISGGLGTACYGLTKALTEQGTEVLFVVPKLTGDEPVNGGALIEASSVPITTAFVQHETSKFVTLHRYDVVHDQRVPLLTTIEIPAELSPYNIAGSNPLINIEQWNDQSLTQHIEEQSIVGSRYTREHRSTKTYPFKGGYGPQLFEEVFRYAAVAAEIASINEFDVIHAHDWMTYPAGIAAKRMSDKRLIVHVHATEYDRAGNNGSKAVYTIEREGLLEANRIVAVSQWTKDTLVTKYNIDPDKIEVVHNGVITESSAGEKAFHPIGSQVVTFLGRITYQKGPEYFVEAAQKVLAVFPDAHFIMAGAGDFLPQMIEKVARLKLSHRFHFTGFLKKSEMNSVLAYTRVYVMPSVSEPFGITPLEAIQQGVPVIISNQSGVSEVLHHALKVNFWDIDALSQAICSVLQYESLSNELQKNAGRALETITWIKAAENLTRIYNELAHT